MIQYSGKKLYQKLEDAYRLLNHTSDKEELFAIRNYIANLYASIICMGDRKISYNKKRCFGTKSNYRKFVKEMNHHNDKLIDNYVECMSFHSAFLGEILPSVEEELQDCYLLTFPDDRGFSKKEGRDVLLSFFHSIGLEKFYQDFLKQKRIYSSIIGNGENNEGFTLYNPLTGDINLFIKQFVYDIKHMNVLVHEMGHAYDLSRFSLGVQEYNRYFYESFYGEVMPRMFERLFHRFLIRNHISLDAAKDSFINYELLNHDYLLESYMLSLLDKDMISSDDYLDIGVEELTKKLEPYFLKDTDLEWYISNIQEVDLPEVYTYTYGDILSLFLCSEVEEYGFDSELMDYFLQNRAKLFNEEFLKECGFGPKNYVSLYQKELKLIKK